MARLPAGRPSRTSSGKKTSDLVRRLVAQGLVDTAHDVSGGGIVALAEMALAGGLGVEYDEDVLERMIAGPGRGRACSFFAKEHDFIVACPGAVVRVAGCAGRGVGYDQIGTVGGDRFKIGSLWMSCRISGKHTSDLFGAPGERR